RLLSVKNSFWLFMVLNGVGLGERYLNARLTIKTVEASILTTSGLHQMKQNIS
ncbi:unnamed protein product, partial [Allacma fusca]